MVKFRNVFSFQLLISALVQLSKQLVKHFDFETHNLCRLIKLVKILMHVSEFGEFQHSDQKREISAGA